MSDRPKLPKSIVVLNIIMLVIILAVCALVVALTIQSQKLGWSLPLPDSPSVSDISTAEPDNSSADQSASSAEIVVSSAE